MIIAVFIFKFSIKQVKVEICFAKKRKIIENDIAIAIK